MFRVPSGVLLLFVLFCGGVSCARTSHRPVYPVRGQVFVQGKPAVQARVTLHPVDPTDTARPSAVVEEDGSFRFSTYLAFDGAPAGEYVVTVEWPSAARKQDELNAGLDLLQGRYSDPKKSPLRVRVREEQNELEPFRLN
jgi:glycine/D-amino acid oxidase-like deaminating enzyme